MGNCGGSEVTVETIDESSKDLQSLPKALTRSAIRKSIRQVNLSNNNLKEIDAKFWLNINLEEIILAGNKQFTTIPDQVATLTKLAKLDLSETGLKNINSFLWSLSSLTWLNVSKTKLSTLGRPNSKSLVYLDISHNALTELPNEISTMVNLKVLKANNNKLTKVPSGIGKCAQLTELYIQSNDLTFLPNESNIKKLKKLTISDEQTEDNCELFETLWEGKTVLSCTYFNCPNLAPIVPKRVDSLGVSKPDEESTGTIIPDEEINVTINQEMHVVHAELNMDKLVQNVKEGEIDNGGKKETIETEPFVIIDQDHIVSHEVVEAENALVEPVELKSDESAKNEKSIESPTVEDSNDDKEQNATKDEVAQIKTEIIDQTEDVKDKPKVDECPKPDDPVKVKEVEQVENYPASVSEADKVKPVASSPIEEAAAAVVEEAVVSGVKETEAAAVEETTVPAIGVPVTSGVEETAELIVEEAVSSAIEDTAVPTVNAVPAPQLVQEGDNGLTHTEDVAEITVGNNEQTIEVNKTGETTETPYNIVWGVDAHPVYPSDPASEDNPPSAADEDIVFNDSPAEPEPSTEKPPISPKPNNYVSEASLSVESKTCQIITEPTIAETNQDEETDQPPDSPKECHKSEIIRHRGVGNVMRSMKMFEVASDAATKSKTSIPQFTRRLSQRTSFRSDQVSQTGTDVVRVAVPIPENHKSKIPTKSPVKTGRIEPMFEPADKPSPKSPVEDIQNIKPLASPTKTVTKPVREEPVPNPTPDLQNGHTNGHVVEETVSKEETMFTFATIKIDDVDLGTESAPSVKLETPKVPEPSVTPPSTPTDGEMAQPMDQVLKMIDFNSEPREVIVKASRAKGASLGLSIISADEEKGAKALPGNTIIIQAVLDISGTTWTGEMPKAGDVLESVDGSNCNNDTISDILADCGNLITLKFQRYPSAFTGYT